MGCATSNKVLGVCGNPDQDADPGSFT